MTDDTYGHLVVYPIQNYYILEKRCFKRTNMLSKLYRYQIESLVFMTFIHNKFLISIFMLNTYLHSFSWLTDEGVERAKTNIYVITVEAFKSPVCEMFEKLH